jgi:hypothetical protein
MNSAWVNANREMFDTATYSKDAGCSYSYHNHVIACKDAEAEKVYSESRY